MVRINEFGEIIRNEDELTNIREKISLEELKSKIIKYIDINDYEEATFSKEKLVSKMKDEYVNFLLNEIGIRNESILRYAVNNFEQISVELQSLLKERNNKQIENKVEIIRNEYMHNEEEKENAQRNFNIANNRIEEDKIQINYEEKVKQITENNINDSIYQLKRILDNLGINQRKIEEISDEIYWKRNELLAKYTLKFNELLTDLDKRITKFVQNVNEEYVQQILNEKNNINENKEEIGSISKFKKSLDVNNSKNQIEGKAIENIKKQEKLTEELSPNEIFGIEENKSTYRSKFDELDASDIF